MCKKIPCVLSKLANIKVLNIAVTISLNFIDCVMSLNRQGE